MSKWAIRALLAAVALVLAIAGGWAVISRGLPALEPWQTMAPAAEAREADLGPSATLADFLRREDEAMREVRERIEPRVSGRARSPVNRYFADSPLNPRHLARDWNRTYELTPPSIRGGVLLVHGMTDSPYAMRSLAGVFEQQGYYALALRMPGHGTVPAGLARASWRDWSAAVRLGVRHVRQRVGPGQPLVLAGYSNGGALVLHYALGTLHDPSLPKVDRLVLLSPMIGVTPFARLTPVISLLSGVPYFDRSAWTSVQPEYNPFKYNSFPANAGHQSHLLTRELDRRLDEAHRSGALARLPPVLTFQSVVDATVLTGAVIDRLYDRLPANGSALVMFDLNRWSAARAFMGPEVEGLVRRLFGRARRPYRISVVTNASAETREVAERDVAPGTAELRDRPLGLSWPPNVFSLSHIAVPFRPDDPLFGLEPDPREFYGIRLGHLEPRGERGVLYVSVDDLMRLACNPFFPYLEARVREWIAR